MKFRAKRMRRAAGTAYLYDTEEYSSKVRADVLTVYEYEGRYVFDITPCHDEDAFRKNPRTEEWAVPFNYRAVVLIPLEYPI